MKIRSLTGHRPYQKRSTKDLLLDRSYWWPRTQDLNSAMEHVNFAAMRLFECEMELQFRGEAYPDLHAPKTTSQT